MRRRKQRDVEEADAHQEAAVRIPHDPFNEQVVIAAAIIGDKVRHQLVGRLSPDLFLGDGHAEIWEALGKLDQKGLQYSPEAIRRMAPGVEVGLLRTIVDSHPALPPNLKHHVAMLLWDHARVEAVRGPIKGLLGALKDPTADPERIRALARAIPVAFDGHGDRRYLHDPATLVRETLAELRRRREGHACWPYGIEGLDRDEDDKWLLVPGAKPGQVTVVTGVSGSGKTTLVNRMALGLARQRRRVLLGAWEMGGEVALEQLGAMSLDWSRYKLQSGDVSDDELKILRDRMDRIAAHIRFLRLPVKRERGRRYGNDEALDLLHGYIADSGCDVFIGDLFKRLLAQTDPDEEEHALIRVQAILDDTKVHGILAQQQRLKDIEMRADKHPTREGIKGSSAWVEVADTILGTNRPALWKDVEDDTFEVDVLKQRYARWPFRLEFDWDDDRGRITNGREVPYEPPSGPTRAASEMDTWVEGSGSKKGKKRK